MTRLFRLVRSLHLRMLLIHFQNNREAVYTCTSSSFEGVVAMMSPDDSWVAKWQRIGNLVKGCYGISVQVRIFLGESFFDSIIRDHKAGRFNDVSSKPS